MGIFATDLAGQLDVLRHDGDSLDVDGTGWYRQQVSLASLLQSHHGRTLEVQVSLEVLGDLTDEALEGKFADKELWTSGSTLSRTPRITVAVL